ncbi:MAG: TonB-dependent receptor [Candidatus Acidiferrales bacterium]
MRLRNFAPLFLAVAAFLPHALFAQAPSSTPAAKPTASSGAAIEGTVFDPSGQIVVSAKVNLIESLVAIAETRTDAQGCYRFEGLRDGTFTVVANSPGFSELSAEIELRGGETHTTDLHLKLSAVQDKVVVSASLGGALAPQLGSTVSVVSQEEIENRGAQSVYDALSNVPGLALAQAGERGAESSAFIRGGDSNYNLVMINGIPLNDFGGGFNLSPLPVDGVESVEVTRGPQSALYGEDAVAGVIDVISDSGEGAPHFTFLSEGGSNETLRLATGGAGSEGGFNWAYDLARFSDRGPVIDDNYRNQTSLITLGYSRSPRRRFEIHFFGDSGADASPGPYGSDPDGLFPGIAASASSLRQDLFGYQANYTEQFSNWFRQVTTVSTSTDNYTYFSQYGDENTYNLHVVAKTQSEITFSPKDVFIAGFEFDHERFQDTYVDDADGNPFDLPRDTYAFFAEDRWNPGSRWFFTAGLRVDNIRTGTLPLDPEIPAASITQVDPRVSVAYIARQSSNSFAGATRIHGSFGTGIRPPNGFELDGTNPNLKPEKSTSFDAGVEQNVLDGKAVLDVTYFYNRFTDQIVFVGGTTLSTFTYANIANSRADGIESSVRLRPTRSIELTMNYTWLNSSILALDNASEPLVPFVVGEPLTRRPRNLGGFDFSWRHRRLMLNANAVVHGADLDVEPNYGTYACELDMQCLFENRGFVDLNGGFAYQMPRGVEIYGRLNNLLDRKYEEAFGYPALHLNFLTGIKFNIPGEHAHASP